MAKPPDAQLRIKLTFPGIGQLGPGKVNLLRNMNRKRSIPAAACTTDMTYRRAWLLVDDINRLFGQPVVDKWLGSQSRQTPVNAGARRCRPSRHGHCRP